MSGVAVGPADEDPAGIIEYRQPVSARAATTTPAATVVIRRSREAERVFMVSSRS